MSIRLEIKKIWVHRPVRFIFVGIINTSIDLLLLNIFILALNTSLIYSNLFSASITICLSYFLNHYIVFQSRLSISIKTFLKFFLITGLSILLVQSIAIYIFEHTFSQSLISDLLGGSRNLNFVKIVQINSAKIVAVLVGMLWNYTLYHFVVFKDDVNNEEESVVPY